MKSRGSDAKSAISIVSDCCYLKLSEVVKRGEEAGGAGQISGATDELVSWGVTIEVANLLNSQNLPANPGPRE
jgi:hypothetical protein